MRGGVFPRLGSTPGRVSSTSLTVASVGAVLLLLTILAIVQDTSTKRLRNVLLITVDTLRADHLGCYGYPLETSPTIDRLAGQSVLFENAYCQIPKTNPSLATIMTGLYPSTHKILQLQLNLPDAYITLAEALHARGYATCGIVGQYNLSKRTGLAQGFESYFDTFPSYEAVTRPGGHFDSMAEKRAKDLVDLGIGWFRTTQPRNFFLWIHFMDPHAAYDPLPPYDEAFPESSYSTALEIDVERIHRQAFDPPRQDLAYYLRRYDGEIRAMDDQIGRLLDELRRAGALEETMVVFTADHGEYMGDPDGPAVQYFSHGETLTEAEIHVPLIWHIPGETGRGIRLSKVVETADIFPTIMDLTGLKGPAWDGQSLSPLFASSNPDQKLGKAFSYSFESNTVSIQSERWKLTWRPKASLAGYFEGRSTFGSVSTSGEWLLYDRMRVGGPLDPMAMAPDLLGQLQRELLMKLEVPPTKRDHMKYPASQPLNDPELIERLKLLGYL
ncbi:MAG: sulfatase [Acidobacteria bacterium]|nr:sulfatase [Acidobacteriota bacterium]